MSRQQASRGGPSHAVANAGRKTAKVHSLFYRGREERPLLRLSGKWLANLGFDVGRRFVIETSPGELQIRVLPEEPMS